MKRKTQSKSSSASTYNTRTQQEAPQATAAQVEEELEDLSVTDPSSKKRRSVRANKQSNKEQKKPSKKMSEKEQQDITKPSVPEVETEATGVQPKKQKEKQESEEEVKSDSNSESNANPSPASALQGLMRRLGGAALDEMIPLGREGLPISLSSLMEGRSRLKGMLQGLKSDDESQQLESLMELNDYLSIGTEESLAGFAVESFVPALINLLNMEHNPDLMLLASRALAHLIEALPSSCSSIVHHGGVPSLCSKLLSIEYIDLAEQSLQALEKLSMEHPTAVLRAGGLMAVLAYLDFFPTGVQRVAVSTAANVCRQVPQDCFEMIQDSVPVLTNLLQYSDQKVVENTLLCFSRLAENFYDSESKIQAIISNGLLGHLVRLISVSNTAAITLSPGTYTIVIRLLANIVHGAPTVAITLLQEGIAEILHGVLVGNSVEGSAAQLITRSQQQQYELLSLVNELLPPLPAEINSIVNAAGKSSIPQSRKARRHEGDGERNTTENSIDPRESTLRDSPEVLSNFAQNLFHILVEMFTSTVNPSVRYKCLSSLTKILFFSKPEMLFSLLQNFAFSSFLAGLLASRDMAVAATAIKMAEILMERLPHIFSKYFRREGVVYEIDRLAKLERPTPRMNPLLDAPSSPPQSAESPINPSDPSGLSIPGARSQSIPIASSASPAQGFLPSGGSSSGFAPPSSAPPPLSSSPSSTSFFFVGSPASINATTTATNTTHDDLKASVSAQARSFRDKFFKSSVGVKEDPSATEELIRLQGLCSKLNRKSATQSRELLVTICGMLSSPEGISTFEFLRSGLIDAMLSYLTSPTDDETVLKRTEIFANIFMELPNTFNDPQAPFSFGHVAAPMQILLSKLHDALNKLEKFPVLINDLPGTSSGLKYLTQPFKIRLLKEGESRETAPPTVVLIEPLATIAALEDFLIPKLRDQVPQPASNSNDVLQQEKESGKDLAGKPKPEGITDPVKIGSRPSSREKGEKTKETKTEAEDDNEEDNEEDVDAEGMDVSEDFDDYEDEEEVLSPTSTDQPVGEHVADLRLSEDPSAPSSAAHKQSAQLLVTRPPESSTKFKPAIYIDQQRLPSTMSIFQAIQRIVRSDLVLDSTPQPVNRMWETVYTLRYRLVPIDSADAPAPAEPTTPVQPRSTIELFGRPSLVKFLMEDRPFQTNTTDTSFEILSMIRVLNRFDLDWQGLYRSRTQHQQLVPQSDYISNRLTAKLMRQLQDPLTLCSGALPPWCKQIVSTCPFIFPFECRRQYFYSTSFGVARALQTLQSSNDVTRASGERSEVRIGRIQRQKVRINRSKLLESGMKVMELYGKQKAMLEVEYFGEVGTGLGPTLEFFTLMSREIQRKDLGVWLDDYAVNDHNTDKMEIDSGESTVASQSKSEFVFCQGGLFPTPIHPSASAEKKLEIFKTLGIFVARALLDGRLLDLPLSVPFSRWILGTESQFEDLAAIAPTVAKSLDGLRLIHSQKLAIERDASLKPTEKAKKISELRLNDARVEDLCLDFVLPGYPEYDLKPNGSELSVTVENVGEYVELVVKAFLVDGVRRQFRAFEEGFNLVFPIQNISIFTVPELETLICGAVAGTDADWTIESLMDTTKADHGYSIDSPALKSLFQIMHDFNADDRRNFLQFITGSPRLPISGFKGLHPRFTVVKKQHEAPSLPDDHLPSVMSCTHYLKLPDYTSREVMKQKILYAIKEGQASFHLS